MVIEGRYVGEDGSSYAVRRLAGYNDGEGDGGEVDEEGDRS